MSTLYFSTGQAARELGITLPAVRLLCENGTIPSEKSPGGQLRIPATAVEKLKRDGLPPIPRPLPTDDATPTKTGNTRRHDRSGSPDDQPEVRAACAQVAITRSQLEKRKVDRELEETEDWFRERTDQQARREAERREIQRQQTAAIQAERRGQEWHTQWSRHALDSIPWEARGQVEPEVHQAVAVVLGAISPDTLPSITGRLVDAAVTKALAPWRRASENVRIVEKIVNALPYEMRNYSKPTEWQVRATQRARAAIGTLPEEADLREREGAAKRAADDVVAEYRDGKLRSSVKEDMCLPIRQHLRESDRQFAAEAVDQAMAALACGSSKARLEAACEKALEPFRAAIERQKAQERHKVIVDSVLGTLPYKFPWRFPRADQELASAAGRQTLAQVPEGADRTAMESALDGALSPFLEAFKRQERKSQLIDNGLREIYPYLLQMGARWNFATYRTMFLESEVKEPIRRKLQAEITGDETAVDVMRKVHDLVCAHFQSSSGAPKIK